MSVADVRAAIYTNARKLWLDPDDLDEIVADVVKVLPAQKTEWAVEVTWVDPKKAGSSTPTTIYGPFETTEQRDVFLERQRRDRAVAATRVLDREAMYTDWRPLGLHETISDAQREELLFKMWKQANPLEAKMMEKEKP